MSKSRQVLFWAILIGGTLGAGELIVRLALEPPGLQARGDDAKLMMLKEPMGYALAPGASSHFTAGGRSAPIHINAAGFRDDPYDEARSADVRILGVGDSFTLGLGVDSADPWPEQLESILGERLGPRVRVVNAGVPGYSTRQMRQMVQAVTPELRPQVVVFAVAGENYRRVERPYVLVAGYLVRSEAVQAMHFGPGEAYYSPIVRWAWLNRLDLWLNQHFELGAHLLSVSFRLYGWAARPPPPPAPTPEPLDLEEAEQRLIPTLREIERADSVARHDGFALVVLLVNSQQEDGSFGQDQSSYNLVLRRYCEAKGIRVVNPLPRLIATSEGRPIYRTPDDYHWSRAAHRVVAEELDHYLVTAGLVPGPQLSSSGSDSRQSR